MFKSVRLHTSHPPDTLRATLSRLVAETSGGVFRGRLTKEGFEVRGVNAYASTYLPFVRGRIHERRDGSELELRFRPHRQVLVFLTIWFTFLLLVSALILLSSRTAGASRLLFLPAPTLLALLSWMLAARVFTIDCRWVLKALREGLEEESCEDRG